MDNKIPSSVVRQIIFDILVERSNAIDDDAEEIALKEMEQTGVTSEYAGEIGWTACGTRFLADEIMEGHISLEEAVTEILSPEEKKKQKEEVSNG